MPPMICEFMLLYARGSLRRSLESRVNLIVPRKAMSADMCSMKWFAIAT